MASLIELLSGSAVSLEDINGEATTEIEYTMYAKLTDIEALKKIASKSETQVQANILLDTDAKVRLRLRLIGDDQFTMCVKARVGGEDEGETEVEQGISEDFFRTLISAAPVVYYKTRYTVPIEETELNWEFDLFTTNSGQPSEWIKIDLEVPSMEFQPPEIPVPVTHVINKAPSEYTDKERALIDLLWNKEWVVNKSGDAVK